MTVPQPEYRDTIPLSLDAVQSDASLPQGKAALPRTLVQSYWRCLMRMLITFIVLLSLTALVAATPTEQTPYGRSIIRFEGRPGPQQVKDPVQRQAMEQALADAGVDARWIAVVDPSGNPYLENPWLPCVEANPAENEAILKEWVAEMHARGTPVMTWFGMAICESAWQVHPEWRQVSQLPWGPEPHLGKLCCPMTGFGDALTNYLIDAIGRLDLDGVWFDGSVWTPIWTRPVPLTCFCDTCQQVYMEEKGRPLPVILEWSNPEFRDWVEWRTRKFGEYIEQVAGRIRAAHPDCAVVINHYHRPGIPWESAVPIDKYQADIITGSEAFEPPMADLVSRLTRAYGRPQSEVWHALDVRESPEATANVMLPHALTCYAAGTYPSFGGNPADPRAAEAFSLMSPILKAIQPFVGGPSLPYAALHVSQQSETFFFTRGGPLSEPPNYYWRALENWDWSFLGAGLTPDYIFDADFTQEKLSRYQVLLMPLSPALSAAEARVALDFARQGGTLVLGLGAGQADPKGEPARVNLLTEKLGFRYLSKLDPNALGPVAVQLQGLEGEVLNLNGVLCPLALEAPEWSPLYSNPVQGPVLASRPYGDGQVLLCALEPASNAQVRPSSGGDTQLLVTEEQAATGKFSLKFVDGLEAPQPFYPDLELNLPSFGLPSYSGGLLEVDLRLEEGADLALELRSTLDPKGGPSVRLHPDGRVGLFAGDVLEAPGGQWFHLKLEYRFAPAGEETPFTLTLTDAQGKIQTGTGKLQADGYLRTDWLVIYGPGEASGTWYLDNLTLASLPSSGESQRLLAMDFEEGVQSLTTSSALPRLVASLVDSLEAQPVRLEADTSVHMGCFEPDSERVLVHLYNFGAPVSDWQQPTGPDATLDCGFPVKAARLALSGNTLSVKRAGDRWLVEVPPIGLYQVVELTRAQ